MGGRVYVYLIQKEKEANESFALDGGSGCVKNRVDLLEEGGGLEMDYNVKTVKRLLNMQTENPRLVLLTLFDVSEGRLLYPSDAADDLLCLDLGALLCVNKTTSHTPLELSIVAHASDALTCAH